MKTLAKTLVPTALMAAGAVMANPIDGQLPNAPEMAAYGDMPIGVRQLEMVNPDQINILAIDPAVEKPAELPR